MAPIDHVITTTNQQLGHQLAELLIYTALTSGVFVLYVLMVELVHVYATHTSTCMCDKHSAVSYEVHFGLWRCQ